MSFNANKAHDVKNGVVLSDGGAGLFSDGGASPLGAQAPLGSKYIASDGSFWTKIGAGINDWKLEGKGKTISSSFTNGLSSTYLSATSATYTTIASTLWPGSTLFGDVSLAEALLSVKNAGKAGAIRIYDSTNAQVIFELASFSNAAPQVFDLGAAVNTPSATGATWEIQLKRVDTGAEARVAAILILN